MNCNRTMRGIAFPSCILAAVFFLAVAVLGASAPPVLHEQNEVAVRRLLAWEVPQIDIQTYKRMPETHSNLVVEVNGMWIFRFPFSLSGAEKVTREASLLKLLESRIHIPIPRYEFFGKTVAMVGYRKIPGDKLSKEEYQQLCTASREEIACCLAGFLYQLHTSVSKDEGEALGFTIYLPKIHELESQLLKVLEPELSFLLEKVFEAYQAECQNLSDCVILHNDFHGGNIAYDRIEARINGVFDFTNATLGEPAVDISYLFSVGTDLAARVAIAYSSLSGLDNIYRRAATLRILHLSEQLLRAWKKNDHERFSRKLASLKVMAKLWQNDED